MGELDDADAGEGKVGSAHVTAKENASWPAAVPAIHDFKDRTWIAGPPCSRALISRAGEDRPGDDEIHKGHHSAAAA
jgi:hypothetical protein